MHHYNPSERYLDSQIIRTIVHPRKKYAPAPTDLFTVACLYTRICSGAGLRTSQEL